MIKTYTTLTEDAVRIRKEVFMEEQGFKDEFDATDEVALHLVAYDGEEPVGTCRVFYDEASSSYVLGRLAIRKPWRGKDLGSALIAEAEKAVTARSGNSLILHSQCRASAFYEKNGFVRFGDIDEDGGCPHVWMKKEL